MMKLSNPYRGISGYSCFGCSPENTMGLQMKFFETDDEIICRWDPKEQFQGYHRVLHGGVQATLLDEIASWYVFVKLGTSGFTKSIKIQYKDQVSVDSGTIELRAALIRSDKKSALMHCRLFQENAVKADAECEYAIFSEAVARKKLHYPGKDAFYGAAGE